MTVLMLMTSVMVVAVMAAAMAATMVATMIMVGMMMVVIVSGSMMICHFCRENLVSNAFVIFFSNQ